MGYLQVVLKLFRLTWPVSLRASRHSRRGRQIRWPVVRRAAPGRCEDGTVSVAVHPRQSMHGRQRAIVT
jgi:hypothetical protein